LLITRHVLSGRGRISADNIADVHRERIACPSWNRSQRSF
jgi:hypothetical protein